MKTTYKTSCLFFLLFLGGSVYAQGDLDQLLAGTKADANYLASGYISPFLKSAGAGINQGWYNTAKPHKIAGFDFTFSVAMVGIPGSDKNYTVDNTKLQNVKLIEDASGKAIPINGSSSVPTIFGTDKSPLYDLSNPQNPAQLSGQPFEGPGGFGLSDLPLKRVPIPVANLSIGLPKGTELKIRWTPEIKLGSVGDFKFFGIGVLHDVKQYIPGIKQLPFDLSGLVAFSKMSLSVGFNDAGTQRGEFSVNGTTIQALISKKISVITPYAGVGYGISKASIKATGDYDLDGNGSNETSNPVSIEANNSGPRMTAGVRLKLLIFTFHVDYTLQKYSTITGGIGLSVR